MLLLTDQETAINLSDLDYLRQILLLQRYRTHSFCLKISPQNGEILYVRCPDEHLPSLDDLNTAMLYFDDGCFTPARWK